MCIIEKLSRACGMCIYVQDQLTIDSQCSTQRTYSAQSLIITNKV